MKHAVRVTPVHRTQSVSSRYLRSLSEWGVSREGSAALESKDSETALKEGS